MTTALTVLAWALVGWIAVGFLTASYAIYRMWKDNR